MAAAITVSVAGVSYVALNPDAVTKSAEAVANEAGCRAVEQAILGYVAANDRPPRTIADVQPYVTGDISAWRIVAGKAQGPGC
jgi:hypothetical protein